MEDFLKGIASELTHGMRRNSVWRYVRYDCTQLLAAEILIASDLVEWGLACVRPQEGRVGQCLGSTTGDPGSVFPLHHP